MLSDQGAGLGAKVMSGTPRDTLHLIDVVFSQDGWQRPDIIVADTGSYSDLVFGLVQLLGMEYRPALADMPDQRGWRVDAHAEDQLGALGLVLNCVVLWNTVYIDAALDRLRAQGVAVLDEGVARLSPFVRRHLNFHGKYLFLLPELTGRLRVLREPDAGVDPEDD
jgi:TnpA family transposase